MRINTNVASLVALEANTQVNKNLTNSLAKLSSGLRINKAADDASGMAIADKLKIQASSLGQSINNANSAAALIQIADKAMGEQTNILDIVKTKLIQAKTATTSSDGRVAILSDIQKLLTQLDMIASTTNYNGVTLLQNAMTDTGSSSSMSFQVGENSSNIISTDAGAKANTYNLGGGSTKLTSTGTGKITLESTSTLAASKSVQLSGTQTATAAITVADATGATGTIDISVSGKVGKIETSADTMTLTITTTNASDQDKLDTIASNNVDLVRNSEGNYTLTGSGTLDLGTFDLSSVKLVSGVQTGQHIEFKPGSTNNVTITNNTVGSTASAKIKIGTDALTDGLVGGDLLSTLKSLVSTDFTAEKSGEFMAVVDSSITQLNTTRSDFGATQNQLESAIRNMMTTKTNVKAAESTIRDVDYAQESANFNKQNIISQAGTYAMSQANNVQQNILKLLQ